MYIMSIKYVKSKVHKSENMYIMSIKYVKSKVQKSEKMYIMSIMNMSNQKKCLLYESLCFSLDIN